MNTPNTNRFTDRNDDAPQFREEWLSAYLDDELSPAQREIVEQRIAVDAEATLMLRDLERIRGLVGSLPAWNGRPLQIPLDGISNSGSSGDDLASAVSAATRPEADFHDELQPVVEQFPTLDTAVEPSAGDSQIIGKRGAPANAKQSAFGGWRSLVLAASLLLVVGLGVLMWPKTAQWNVATSARVEDATTEPQSKTDAPALSAATDRQPAPAALAPPSRQDFANGEESFQYEAAAGTLKDSGSQDGTQSDNLGADRATTEALPPASAAQVANSNQRTAETMQRELMQNSEGRNSGFSAPAESTESLSMRNEMQRSDIQRGEMLRGGNQPSDDSVAAMGAAAPPVPLSLAPKTLGKTTAARPALQLARSAAWQESELSAGVARLAPLLHFSPVKQPSDALGNQPPLDRASVASQAASEPHIPVALAALQPSPADDKTQLTELLQQASFGLSDVTAQYTVPHLPGLVPFGTDTTQAPTTIALFVSRGQAAQILQAAQQNGQLKASPIWIRSASSLSAALDDQQKVVVLLTPQ